jgi:tRNA(Ile)-lysidine synthase
VPAARPDPSALFKPVEAHGHLALAVSGGSDSMALLRLAAQWGRAKLTVLTVDHCLRAAASEEARQVAEWSTAHGIAHITLKWQGQKPSTGLQAKARAVRYSLMTQWCLANGATALLTAHTLDDQAETVLMRLARTSSLDSLSGIPRNGTWEGVKIFRPLLDVRRDDLRDFLRKLGQPWIEDPSNDDERFERVRIRKAIPLLKELGISPESLAGLARQASETVGALARASLDWVRLHVQPYETGYCQVPLDLFSAEPEVLKTRILGWLISRYGAGQTPEPHELQLLVAGFETKRTLGGAIIAPRKTHFLVGREPGRIDQTPIEVPPSGEVTWDHRFEVRAPPGSLVMAAGQVPDLPRNPALPRFVQESLPAIRLPDLALVVPNLGIGAGAEARLTPRLH